MNIVNGFFPFEVIDSNKDGFITFEEFFSILHPVEHAPIFDTGNFLAKHIYTKKVHEAMKKPWFAVVWWLMTDSLEDKVTKEQYDALIPILHTLGIFDANNDLVVHDHTHPRVQYAKDQYDKIKIRIEDIHNG